MSNFQRYFDDAQSKMREIAGREIIYSRKSLFVKLTAVVGKTVTDNGNEGEVSGNDRFRDYLIQASDLKLNRAEVEPIAGDVITETIGNKTFTYLVNNSGNGSCYEYLDRFNLTYRIHTLLRTAE